MKVELEDKKVFKPIEIIIESYEELIALEHCLSVAWVCMGMGETKEKDFVASLSNEIKEKTKGCGFYLGKE